MSSLELKQLNGGMRMRGLSTGELCGGKGFVQFNGLHHSPWFGLFCRSIISLKVL